MWEQLVFLGIFHPGREEREFTALTTQDGPPERQRAGAEDVGVVGLDDMPHPFCNLRLQLPSSPPGIAGEYPQVTVGPSHDLDRRIEVQEADVVEQRPPARGLLPR